MKVLSGDRKRGAVSRFFAVTLLLLFILMVAIWFGARTDGGRDIAESKLTGYFGVDVSIESMKIGFPYVLVMENVRTAEFEGAGTPGFSVAEVKLWRGLKYWSLHLKQLIVRVKDDGAGNWKPDSLARLGDLKGAGIVDVVKATDSIRNKVRLRVENSDVGWLNEKGVELAVARDVDFRMLPVQIDDRKMHYYYLDIYKAEGLALVAGGNTHWEWLTTPKTDFIELPGRREEKAGRTMNDERGKNAGENVGENVGENDERGTMNAERGGK